MGCIEERPKREEEQLAQFSEQQFGLSYRTTRHLIPELDSFPLNLPPRDLISLKRRLKMSDLHLSSDSSDEFYRYFESESDRNCYEIRKFGVLVIILTSDQIHYKAEVLFRFYALGMAITRQDAQKGLEFAFLLATEVIPSTLSQNVLSRFPKAKLAEYIAYMKNRRQQVLDFLIEKIFHGNERLSMDKFVKAFQGKGMEQYLMSKGIREHVVGSGK